MSWFERYIKTSQHREPLYSPSPVMWGDMVGIDGYNETGSPVSNGIAKFIDAVGNRRYVYIVNGRGISQMSVNTDNIIYLMSTEPEYQRQGFAKKLLRHIQNDIPEVKIDNNLNEQSEGFVRGVGLKLDPTGEFYR